MPYVTVDDDARELGRVRSYIPLYALPAVRTNFHTRFPFDRYETCSKRHGRVRVGRKAKKKKKLLHSRIKRNIVYDVVTTTRSIPLCVRSRFIINTANNRQLICDN